MKKKLISLCLAVIMSVAMLMIPAQASASGGAVTTDALNLRASASTSAKIIQVMPRGAKVIVQSTSNGWSKVIYNGETGYASSDYLKSAKTVSGSFGTGAVTGSDVRMRSGAGTDYKIVATLDKGTKVQVTGVSGNWYAVTCNGKDGYISSDYVSISSGTSSSSTDKKTTTKSGKITGSDVRMRSGAGTKYKIITTLDKGTKVQVTGTKGSWYAVTYNGKDGYVSSDFVKVSSSSSSSTDKKTTGQSGSVIGTSVRMRSGPGTSYSILGTYSNGVKLTVLGSENGWYKVSYNGKTGYIKSDYVRVTPKETTTSTDGTITGNDVRLRLGPSTSYSIVATYPKGTAVKISGISGSWYEVSVNGKYGYISKDFVSTKTQAKTTKDKNDSVPKPSESMSATGIITGSDVRMRGGPGTKYAIVCYLGKGAKIDITGKTGNWYAATYNGQKGYVSADYIKISDNSSQAGQIIAAAKEYLGTPYVWGGTTPKGFDCSGFVQYIFGQYGYKLHRVASDMYANDGSKVDKANLKPGDLVFFSSSSDAVGHVGLYIGNGQFIHASSGSGKVVITELEGSSYYITHYVGAKRVL